MTARIAIIGAGLIGSLAALDLARRGIPVDLIDRGDLPVTEASFFNEGKVHLGFLYAHDPSLDTSRLMIEGATSFRSIVADLTGFDVSQILSTPFLYAVHRESLLSPDAFQAHLERCCLEFNDAAKVQNLVYVDGLRTVEAERLSHADWEQDLDPATFNAVFRTSERAVDPRRLAPEVTRAVLGSAGIAWHPGTNIRRVSKTPSGDILLSDSTGRAVGKDLWNVVVNATWSDLLRLDSQMGLDPPHDWSYRYKLSNRIMRPVDDRDLNSVTVVLGAFGDIVNFGPDGGIFLSWYPYGRMLMTDEVELPDLNGADFADARSAAYMSSRAEWEGMSASLRSLGVAADPVDTRGGMILASGRLDVDDPASPLHARVEVGVKRAGSYFSVNTGKFTLAPLMARRVADEVAKLVDSGR